MKQIDEDNLLSNLYNILIFYVFKCKTKFFILIVRRLLRFSYELLTLKHFS